MIRIYTTNTCGYCKMVKNYLAKKGHQYEEVNMDQNPERREEAYKLSGALTVPITVFETDDSLGDKGKRLTKVVVGWNLPYINQGIGMVA